LVVGLRGCSTLGYLLQAGKGQLAMMNRARPIEEVLRDEKTPPRIRRLLAEIPSVNEFGRAQGLKPTSNYRNYVKLDRPAAVYVVSACEPLRFESREWRFPIVGSVPYLGWFDLDGARKMAEDLRVQGLDVDVRGARAYSTLGWFPDPVLSSMIPEGDEAMGDLVNVVLHESVHATLYVSGQTYFNESLASFMADRMVYSYLDQKFGAESVERVSYEKAEKDGEKRVALLRDAYARLDALYASGRSDAEKLVEKKAVLERLKTALDSKRDFNNAALIQYKAYDTGEKEFTALFEACGKDWRRFMQVLEKVQLGSFKEEHQKDLAPVLLPLAQAGCA
jgi:predicted aminopeptidase